MSTQTPKVSIILPTYNGQQFIEKSIESCIDQTHQNIELIIVDDASTDQTAEIIRRYGERDTRIKVITNKKNKKLPGSLNVGHRASSGDLITWTSDDNFFRNDAIENMANYLKTHSDVGMVYCDYWVIDSKEEIVKAVRVPSIEMLSNYNCIGACFMYRKETHKRTGSYSSNVLYAEDYDYWLRIASRNSVQPIHEILYYYRFHDDSLTSRVKKEKIRLAANFALARNLPYLPWLSTEQKYDRMKRIIRNSLTNHAHQKLLLYFMIAFYISPRLTFKQLVTKLKSPNI